MGIRLSSTRLPTRCAQEAERRIEQLQKDYDAVRISMSTESARADRAEQLATAEARKYVATMQSAPASLGCKHWSLSQPFAVLAGISLCQTLLSVMRVILLSFL